MDNRYLEARLFKLSDKITDVMARLDQIERKFDRLEQITEKQNASDRVEKRTVGSSG